MYNKLYSRTCCIYSTYIWSVHILAVYNAYNIRTGREGGGREREGGREGLSRGRQTGRQTGGRREGERKRGMGDIKKYKYYLQHDQSGHVVSDIQAPAEGERLYI